MKSTGWGPPALPDAVDAEADPRGRSPAGGAAKPGKPDGAALAGSPASSTSVDDHLLGDAQRTTADRSDTDASETCLTLLGRAWLSYISQ